MPAGATWSVYIRYMTAAMLSMFAGAQVVHSYYRPLDDLEELIKKEKEALLREQESVKAIQETHKKSSDEPETNSWLSKKGFHSSHGMGYPYT